MAAAGNYQLKMFNLDQLSASIRCSRYSSFCSPGNTLFGETLWWFLKKFLGWLISLEQTWILWTLIVAFKIMFLDELESWVIKITACELKELYKLQLVLHYGSHADRACGQGSESLRRWVCSSWANIASLPHTPNTVTPNPFGNIGPSMSQGRKYSNTKRNMTKIQNNV